MEVALFDAIECGDVAAVESCLQTPGIDVNFLFVTGDENNFSHLLIGLLNTITKPSLNCFLLAIQK